MVRGFVAQGPGKFWTSQQRYCIISFEISPSLYDIFDLSEPLPAHAEEDAHLCESEWRSQVELLPNIKEEPKQRNLPDVSQGAGDSRGNCSHAEQQMSNHLSATNASPSPPTSVEVKTESCREINAVHSDCEEAEMDSSTTTKISKPSKPEQQVKGPLRSNGKPSPHVLQIKNVRPLKLPLSRSSHTTQSIQRWHSCKECGKGFSFACQLEVHMRWHTKEKPYSCAVCRKSFTTVSMLKRHHRIHTGEKPFRCHVCGKCFNQSAHLNTHFRLHTRERAAWNRPAQGK